MNIKIKDMPVHDRPRERLINLGSSFLTDEELLAIILKTGHKDYSVKCLAHTILKEIKDIKNLNNMDYQNLIKIKGIGPSKATELLAIIELGRRVNRKVDSINNKKFTNSRLVFDYYKDLLKEKKQEYFYAVYLDNNKRIIQDKLLFMGTINQSVVHPREIFKEAYTLSSSYIICVHNHPSNNVLPSKEDINFTKKIMDIGNLMGIKVLDHIIIGRDNYFSFYENKEI